LVGHLSRYKRLKECLGESLKRSSEIGTVARHGVADVLREVYDKALLIFRGIFKYADEIGEDNDLSVINLLSKPCVGRKFVVVSDDTRVGLLRPSKYSSYLRLSASDFSDEELLADTRLALGVVDSVCADLNWLVEFLKMLE